uniref:Uncharacterized protein n=1 Tax=Megaselia scalaris TaxID=36166 RepID=T1GLQ8_MEGSC
MLFIDLSRIDLVESVELPKTVGINFNLIDQQPTMWSNPSCVWNMLQNPWAYRRKGFCRPISELSKAFKDLIKN